MKIDNGKQNILLTNSAKLNSHELAVLPSIINKLNLANNVLDACRYAIAHPTALVIETAAVALLAGLTISSPLLLCSIESWIVYRDVEGAIEDLMVGISGIALISIASTCGMVYLIWRCPSLIANRLESDVAHTIDTMPAGRRAHLSYALYDRVLARLAPLGFDDTTNQRILASLPH